MARKYINFRLPVDVHKRIKMRQDDMKLIASDMGIKKPRITKIDVIDFSLKQPMFMTRDKVKTMRKRRR